jgi:hypothetical protein
MEIMVPFDLLDFQHAASPGRSLQRRGFTNQVDHVQQNVPIDDAKFVRPVPDLASGDKPPNTLMTISPS